MLSLLQGHSICMSKGIRIGNTNWVTFINHTYSGYLYVMYVTANISQNYVFYEQDLMHISVHQQLVELGTRVQTNNN